MTPKRALVIAERCAGVIRRKGPQLTRELLEEIETEMSLEKLYVILSESGRFRKMKKKWALRDEKEIEQRTPRPRTTIKA